MTIRDFAGVALGVALTVVFLPVLLLLALFYVEDPADTYKHW